MPFRLAIWPSACGGFAGGGGYYDEVWYQQLFSQAKSGEIAGELTPDYLVLEVSEIEAMKRMNPKLKIIVLLRNPVDRAWSALRFHASKGHNSVDLSSAVECMQEAAQPWMVPRGLYFRALERFSSQFPGSQILVGFYDAIAKSPKSLLGSITEFLGISPFPDTECNSAIRVNESPMHAMPDGLRESLTTLYAEELVTLSQRFGSYANLWLGPDSAANCNNLYSAATLDKTNFYANQLK